MMSEQRPFDYFIDLINFDQKLHLCELDIKKQEQEIVQLQDQKKSLDLELHKAKNELHDAKKLVDEKELEMKELEMRESDKKKRMDRVSNQKEYQSIKHELGTITSSQLALEDSLIAAWNQFEIAQNKFDKHESEYAQAVNDLDAQIIQQKVVLKELQEQLSEKKKIRSSKEESVPEEWLEKYMIMRARVSDPVVPVVDGSCVSCFNPVTGQDIISINRNKLLQCKGCYRFLYNKLLDR